MKNYQVWAYGEIGCILTAILIGLAVGVTMASQFDGRLIPTLMGAAVGTGALASLLRWYHSKNDNLDNPQGME